MAHVFDNSEKRLVLPNWRSFKKTAELGELSQLKKGSISDKRTIDLLITDWKENPSIGVAADIISTATVNRWTDMTEVHSVADFILNNKVKSSMPLYEEAKKIAGKNQVIQTKSSSSINDNIDAFSLQIFRDNKLFKNRIYTEIANSRQRLKVNPRNAILWVEMSRLYSIIAENDIAYKCIRNAVYLAPNNRYVLRSMTRFCVKYGNLDFAHNILRKSEVTKYDPWLTATEIALATFRGRFSKFIHSGLEIINSKNVAPFHLSELASSIATLELMNGSNKNGSKLVQTSLIRPNDNTLAQAEWITENLFKIDNFDITTYNRASSNEAMAKWLFSQKRWQEALTYSISWFLDFPYSKKPILFSTHIANTFLSDNEKAIEIGTAGLISHPKDATILNNLAYSYCLSGELEKATDMLDRAACIDASDIEKICLLATNGLLFYRKGHYEIGRFLYDKAIEQANSHKDKKTEALALGNLVREEYLAKKAESASALYNVFLNKIEGSSDASLLKLKEEISNLTKTATLDIS